MKTAIISLALSVICASVSFAADAVRVYGDMKTDGIHFSDSSTLNSSKDLMRNKGSWGPSVLYSAGDVIQSGGNSYSCTTANINVPPPNTSYWAVLAQATSGLMNRGTWSSASLYYLDDVVQFNGASYVSIATSMNQPPPNATFWSVLASQGPQGPQGPQGVQGVQGPKGDVGSTGPYAAMPWVVINGTSQMAAENTGLITTNSAQTNITAPTSPTVGSIIKIASGSTGGWKLFFSANQFVSPDFYQLPSNAGFYWMAHEPNRQWSAIASSNDGTKLVAVADQIYTSTDSGVTWTPREIVPGEGIISRYWSSIASSSDGTKLVAVAGNSQIYTSADSGVTWTASESVRNWRGIASSSDGTKLVAVAGNSQIYTSADSGVTWTARESVREWMSVASSSDGTKLVAGVWGGRIYTSTDSGVTWTPRESDRYWGSIASSSDGNKLVAGADHIYRSTDSGVNWVVQNTSSGWGRIASSSDGTKLILAGSPVYTSVDSGVTWVGQLNLRNIGCSTVASSGDGIKLVVGCGQIYTSTSTPITTGPYLTGGQDIELLYAGNGQFIRIGGYATVSY